MPSTVNVSRAKREANLHAKRRELAKAIESGAPESLRRKLKEEIDAIKWLLSDEEE